MVTSILQLSSFRRSLAGLVFSFLLLTSCKSKSTSYEPTYSKDSLQKKTLTFGLSAQPYFEIWAAFVAYLNDHLPDVNIQLVARPTLAAFIDSWKERSFDVLLANGGMALDSVRYGYSCLGTSVEETSYAGAILVNNDSSINNFSDLKGKLVASVGDPAVAGHILQMSYLLKNGVNVNKDIKFKYLESFESVILNIYLGKCSAGFTSLSNWKSFLKKRPEIAIKVDKKWETPIVAGNLLLIRNDISEETISELRSVILTMHLNERGRKALADIGYLKFTPTDSNTYKPLRNLLIEYQELSINTKK